jgi:hypothetical protein
MELSSLMDEEQMRTLQDKVGAAFQTNAVATTTTARDDSDIDMSSVMNDEQLRTLGEKVGAIHQAPAETTASTDHDESNNELSVMDEEQLHALEDEVGAALETAAETTATTPHEDNSVSELSYDMDEEQLRTLANTVAAAFPENAAATTTVTPAHDGDGDSDLSSVMDAEPLRILENKIAAAALQKNAGAHEDDNSSDSDLSAVMDDEPLRTLEDTVGAAHWTKAAARRSALRKPGQASRANGARVRFDPTTTTTAADDNDDDSDSDLSSVMDDEALHGLEYIVAASRWKSAAVGPSVLRKPGQAARVDGGAKVTFATSLVTGAAANPFSRAELGMTRSKSVAASRIVKARQEGYLRKVRAEEEAAAFFDEWCAGE